MKLLITDIQWDCDGMKPVEDCGLPTTVLVLNAPDTFTNDDEEGEELGTHLSDVYGFLFDGYKVQPVDADKPGSRVEWGPHLAVMNWPTAKRYRVGTATPQYFDTLDEARTCANTHFDKTGVVVAIEEA